MPDDPKAAPVPFLAYLLGSVVLFGLVGGPLIDFLAGDWEGYGKSAMKGAAMGAFFGLCMWPFERWLARRSTGR